MDFDHKFHFRTTSSGNGSSTAANDPLICFASRPCSSSSMKLARSILSPGRPSRNAGGPVSLSSSLSRRLRPNGSLRGSASPFLANTGKRRGGGFENPEPSSPKVTCIGQVRVKSKKKVEQTRNLSTRRAGEISFRKPEPQITTADNTGGDVAQVRYPSAGGARCHNPSAPQECLPHRNQRWVHLPISICDALREFNCLFPCKSSCFSRDRAGERRTEPNEGGCGSVFARWLVSVNDGDGGTTREIELVVGGGDENTSTAAEKARVSMRSSRRHVFEDIEIRDHKIEIKGQCVEDGVESARVSICIPPKNALLLMRCRSDPMKMASLASRLSWDPQTACKNDFQNDKDDKIDEIPEKQSEARVWCERKGDSFQQEVDVLIRNSEENSQLFMETESFEENKEELLEEIVQDNVGEKGRDDAELNKETVCNEANLVDIIVSSSKALLDDENIADEEEEEANHNPLMENLEQEALMENEKEEEGENEVESASVPGKVPTFAGQESSGESFEDPMEDEGTPTLPECLLLMMCEPKLSMEVSKETWVCSTDFVRLHTERPRKAEAAAAPPKAADTDTRDERRFDVDFRPVSNPAGNGEQLRHPPRSSCCIPVAAAASMTEQKSVNALGREPFVLTRCKSEPMRTAAAKLIPEPSFWKNAVRELEPVHRQTAARMDSVSEPSRLVGC